MREIKFRGKRVDNGEWIYGNLLQIPRDTSFKLYLDKRNEPPIELIWAIQIYDELANTYQFIEIDESTICQFTGMYDSSGEEIYEGDMFWDSVEEGFISVVEWCQDGYKYIVRIVPNVKEDDFFPDLKYTLNWLELSTYENEIKVINNVHDIIIA